MTIRHSNGIRSSGATIGEHVEKRQVRRITRELSPTDQHRLKIYRRQIAETLSDLVVRDQMRKEASEEATLSGELRGAVHTIDLSLSRIAVEVGVTPVLLDEFLTGKLTLRSDVMDRLAVILGYELQPLRPGAWNG